MAMGYQGYAKVVPSAGTPLLLLATGASVNLVLEPIYSSAVWGAGWYNAATTTHYADGALRYEGSIDIDMQATSDFWNMVKDWAIDWRAYSKSLDISPDGVKIYQFTSNQVQGDPNSFDNSGAWVSSLSFSTSEGSFVTSSIGVVALNRTFADAGPDGYLDNRDGVTTAAEMDATNPLNPNSLNISPIPFWRTNAQFLYDAGAAYPGPFGAGSPPQTGMETVEWSVDLSNNQVVLYTCNGSRQATAVLMGAIDVSGSVTLYHPQTVFDPILGGSPTHGVVGTGTEENPFLTAEKTRFLVEIETGPATSLSIELPAVVVESDDYGLRGQSDVTNRGFSMKGLGGRTSGGVILPPMMMETAV